MNSCRSAQACPHFSFSVEVHSIPGYLCAKLSGGYFLGQKPSQTWFAKPSADSLTEQA